MGRTLVASPEGVNHARKALKVRNLTQTDLGIEVELAYSTVSNFFNEKPIYRTNFQEICTFLDLDWQNIAAPGEEETQKLTLLEELWQKLQTLGSPTEQMGLVIAQEETLGWTKKIPSRYEKSVRMGSYIRFEVNLETPGYLLLLQKDTLGQLWCFCPSCFAPQPQLEKGKTSLPQESSPITSFHIEGTPGKEQILAVITQDMPKLEWLSQANDEPLELTESFLGELLNYISTSRDNQIIYTEYEIVE
ncbi:MAG: DUF4384 domain-containing protein [Cyanomargarita calcarea GSE-NOS-MK-12-04C]|jgi:DNA-binding Xre family transcriptional regulator|uniref:DUF4384 domain-containing protein n=1 Tax=Cyanomargarita calcarea GSE-NOS-MK-12-04C TaxID=2839659 RepID=A0A951QLZ8_9CYAN|nr:DUF4384 domain-containing protein [Cyanomargarita calcarea GSE-NOS-MK-12-04C]